MCGLHALARSYISAYAGHLLREGGLHVKLKSTLALLGALLFASPASAGWTGCYVGAHGGLAAGNLNTDLTVVGAGSLLNVDGFSATGSEYGLQVGCDYQMNQFVLGAFADYSWYNADFSITSPLLGASLATTGLDTSWSIGGRAGFIVNKSTLIYGLVAWSQMEMKPINVLMGAALLPLGSTDGISVGGGIETELMPNVRLKLEYRYTQYDKITAPIIPTFLNLDVEPDVHSVRLGISYAFTVPTLN